MNNKTAHIQFKVILDKNAQGVAYGGAPAFLPQEVDIFLNQAQNQIFSNKISGNNPLKQGFESSFLRMSELDTLVKSTKLTAKNTEYNEFAIDNLHEDNRFIILGFNMNMGSYLTNCVLTDHSIAKSYKQTYNNTPWVKFPVVVLEDNRALLYVDPIMMVDSKYAPTADGYSVNVTYLSKPKEFDYTKPDEELDFPEDVMEEIVNRAVVLALENIESQRTSIKTQLNQLSE